MDITKFFLPTENDKLDGRALNSSKFEASTSSQTSAGRELNNLQEKEQVKKKRQVLPEKIKKEQTNVTNCERGR